MLSLRLLYDLVIVFVVIKIVRLRCGSGDEVFQESLQVWSLVGCKTNDRGPSDHMFSGRELLKQYNLGRQIGSRDNDRCWKLSIACLLRWVLDEA